MNPFNEAMHEVLQRPQYDILTGRAVDYQRVIFEAIGRAIADLLSRIDIDLPGGYNLQLITTVFIVVLALLLLGASIGLAYILLKRAGKKAQQELGVSALFDDIANKRFSLADLLRLSKEFEEKRQFRDAVRHHYIAVLVSLDDKRTIRVDKSKTNAQLARELADAAPALAGSFVSVVDVFHQTWFGMKVLGEDDYRSFAKSAEVLL